MAEPHAGETADASRRGSGPDLVEHGRIAGREALHPPGPLRRRVEDLERPVEAAEHGVLEVQERRAPGEGDLHHVPGGRGRGGQHAAVEAAAPEPRRAWTPAALLARRA